MAIVQISQIQVRRGLNADLPQLAGGELGWSVDTRQLYIGNGTLAEGAPSLGVTEILTEYSDMLSTADSYTFKGLSSGSQVVTGINALNPIARTLQDKLDDIVSVKDFGALGDGSTDDTVAIQRAINSIFNTASSSTLYNHHRTVYFPAGVYIISSALLLPPYTRVLGEGKHTTVISSTTGTIFNTSDILGQIGTLVGYTTSLPVDIKVDNIHLKTTSSSVPVAVVDSASDVIFSTVKFQGGNVGLAILNSNVSATTANIKIDNSVFSGQSTGPTYVASTVVGPVTRTNYLDTSYATVSSGTTVISTLANGAGFINYQVQDSSNRLKVGTISYTVVSGVGTAVDTTTASSGITANVWVWANANLTVTASTTSTVKYNLKQFI